MKKEFGRHNAMTIGVLALAVLAVSSGCASKKYVRTQVDESASNVTARLEPRIEENQQKIDANSQQIGELNSVTRENSQQIASVGETSQRALSAGQGAQTTAERAVSQIASLEGKFLNRNDFIVLSEERIQFGFDSTRIEERYFEILGGVARQMRNNPDAILVMEGRTDSIGNDAYNIRLGEKRLEAVTRHLIVQRGVPIHKVYRMSYGEDRPLASNETREGRAQNRAVLIQVLGHNFLDATGPFISEAEMEP